MNPMQPQSPPSSPPNEPVDWNRVLTDQQLLGSFSRAIDALSESVRDRTEEHGKAAARTVKYAFWFAVFVLAAVIVPTTILTWAGKLQPDAATFVLGTIIGASFTFVVQFFSGEPD